MAGRLAEVARFVPDLVVLFHRLLRDPRVPRRAKVVVALLTAYLVVPIDLVPDFIPGLGQLDDAFLAALALRSVLRSTGEPVIREHWPGPPATLGVVLSVAADYPRSRVALVLAGVTAVVLLLGGAVIWIATQLT